MPIWRIPPQPQQPQRYLVPAATAAPTNYSATATVLVGVKATASRTIGIVRQGAVLVGVKVPNNNSISQTQQSNFLGLCGNGGYIKVGERFTSFPASSISSISLYLKKVGSPTGTMNVVVRQVSDDSLLGTLGSIDVSTINTDPTYYTFNNSVVNPSTQDIRILAEYSGGGLLEGNNISVGFKTADIYASGVLITYNADGSEYVDRDYWELTWQNLTYSTGTPNTGRTIGINRSSPVLVGIKAIGSRTIGMARTGLVKVGISANPTTSIGSAAIDRATTLGNTYTFIDKNNPASITGRLTSVEIFPAASITGLRVGTFYLVSGTTYKCRDSQAISGIITGGVKSIKSVNLSVVAGDFIGYYFADGLLADDDTGGAGVLYVSGEHIDPGDEATYTEEAGNAMSLHGIGVTLVGRAIGINRLGSAPVGVKSIGSRVLVMARKATTLVGVLAHAIGLRGTKAFAATATVIVGVVATASRGVGYSRNSLVTVGVKVNASRVVGIIRKATAKVGILVSAFGIKGAHHYIATALVTVGVKVDATRAIAIQRTANVAVGVVARASRVLGLIRKATTKIGILVHAIVSLIRPTQPISFSVMLYPSELSAGLYSVGLDMGLYSVGLDNRFYPITLDTQLYSLALDTELSSSSLDTGL